MECEFTRAPAFGVFQPEAWRGCVFFINSVWRKWFMLLIWLVGSIMIFALALTHLFTSYSGLFEWFDIYWLFGFILMEGYFSFFFAVKVERLGKQYCQ